MDNSFFSFEGIVSMLTRIRTFDAGIACALEGASAAGRGGNTSTATATGVRTGEGCGDQT